MYAFVSFQLILGIFKNQMIFNEKIIGSWTSSQGQLNYAINPWEISLLMSIVALKQSMEVKRRVIPVSKVNLYKIYTKMHSLSRSCMMPMLCIFTIHMLMFPLLVTMQCCAIPRSYSIQKDVLRISSSGSKMMFSILLVDYLLQMNITA